MLHYISHPPYLCRNVSCSSTISFLPLLPHLPYSPSPSDSSVPVSYPSSATACHTLIPRISREGYSHHHLDRCIHSFCSHARYKSMIGQVATYCTTVFWRRVIYNPISSSPTISSAFPIDGYTHIPSRLHLRTMPIICRAARW